MKKQTANKTPLEEFLDYYCKNYCCNKFCKTRQMCSSKDYILKLQDEYLLVDSDFFGIKGILQDLKKVKKR